MGERELEVLGEELLDVGALDIIGLLDLDNAEDLKWIFVSHIQSHLLSCGIKTYVDGPEASTVTGSHVGVQSLDGIGSRHLTELLVHVVSAGAGVVADPDTEVLDGLGALLSDLQKVHCQNENRIASVAGWYIQP